MRLTVRINDTHRELKEDLEAVVNGGGRASERLKTLATMGLVASRGGGSTLQGLSQIKDPETGQNQAGSADQRRDLRGHAPPKTRDEDAQNRALEASKGTVSTFKV